MDLSIVLLTYNHDRYVAEALQSIYVQDFSGSWELVVADDCSTDRTLAIIREWTDARPGGFTIRLLTSEVNLGMQANLRRGIEACTGDFIALLEGDDRWTSAKKLRVQHTVMLKNPSLSSSAHLTTLLTLSDSGEWQESKKLAARVAAGQLGLRDVLLGKSPHVSSLMFRRDALPSTPAWFNSIQMADWPMVALLAASGPIAIADQQMSAYRKGVGTHSTCSRVERWRRTVECCEAIASNMDLADGLGDLALARIGGTFALALLLAWHPASAASTGWSAASHFARYCIATLRRTTGRPPGTA